MPSVMAYRMEKKKKGWKKKIYIFHIWEHVKVIKVTQQNRDGNIAHRSASRIRNKLHFRGVYDGKKKKQTFNCYFIQWQLLTMSEI